MTKPWEYPTDMLQVVIPFTEKEVPVLLKNVELCFKMEGFKTPNPTLVAVESTMPQDVVDRAFKAIQKVFWRAELYQYYKGKSGWPAGPNHAFQCAARYIAESRQAILDDAQIAWNKQQGNFRGKLKPLPEDIRQSLLPRVEQPWLWWEQDATPLQPGWLKTLYAAYKAGGKALAGHIVGGMEHMNGVGIYPADLRQYSINAFTCQKTPWDVAMKKETRLYTTNLNHLILHYWNIYEGKNFNGPKGVPLSVKSLEELQQWITPEAVLLHRCKDGSIADALLSKYNVIHEEITAAKKAAKKAQRAEAAAQRKLERKARKSHAAAKGKPQPISMAAAGGIRDGIPGAVQQPAVSCSV